MRRMALLAILPERASTGWGLRCGSRFPLWRYPSMTCAMQSSESDQFPWSDRRLVAFGICQDTCTLGHEVSCKCRELGHGCDPARAENFIRAGERDNARAGA